MDSPYPTEQVLTPEQIYAIGFVASEWANLEFGIMIALGEMLKLAPAPAVTLAGLFTNIVASTNALIRVSNELVEWDDLTNDIEAICKQIVNLATERNHIVHASWNANIYHNPTTGKIEILQSSTASGTGFPKSGTTGIRVFTFTALEMREVGIASYEAKEALLHLVWRKPQPSPDTPTLLRVLERQTRRSGQAPKYPPKPSRA